jgi:septum formation protein
MEEVFGTIDMYLPFLNIAYRKVNDMQQIVLASSSPRRQELLKLLQIPFIIHSSEIDETLPTKMKAEEAVMQLAFRKADAVLEKYPDHLVIGSDTVVVLDGKILGKPEGRNHAFDMLKSLSGKTHKVFTGVSLLSNKKSNIFFEETEVTFWELSEDDIYTYLDTGEPFDKAGAYGIQGFGSLLVKEIKGDYFNVVGLPVSRLARELKSFL